jgi:hypothetical protein
MFHNENRTMSPPVFGDATPSSRFREAYATALIVLRHNLLGLVCDEYPRPRLRHPKHLGHRRGRMVKEVDPADMEHDVKFPLSAGVLRP